MDTSTPIQALALVEGKRLLARRHHDVHVNHAASLLSNISDMLNQHAWSPNDLDLVAIGLGPGSFTGLRVGLANAKGLARAAGASIVGVSTLESIARPVAALKTGFVVSLIDARRAEVYAAVYQVSEGVMRLHVAEATYRAETLHELVSKLSQEAHCVLVGNGIRAHPELADWQDQDVQVLGAAWDSPSPFSIAMLGLDKLAQSGADDLVTLEPNYIRPSDAEISWTARNPSS